MSTALTHEKKNIPTIEVDPAIFVKMRTYIDDQIATSKLLQGEIDVLTGNYTEFTPDQFLHDIKSRRNIPV